MNSNEVNACILAVILIAGLILGCMFGLPIYKVWQEGKRGEAELRRAEQNKQIKPDDSVTIDRTTKVTGKGQIYFVNRFLGKEMLSPEAGGLIPVNDYYGNEVEVA